MIRLLKAAWTYWRELDLFGSGLDDHNHSERPRGMLDGYMLGMYLLEGWRHWAPHRYNPETYRCICGSVVVLFARGGEGCARTGRPW